LKEPFLLALTARVTLSANESPTGIFIASHFSELDVAMLEPAVPKLLPLFMCPDPDIPMLKQAKA